MRKYLSVIYISLKQEFAYKLNFLMWRFRNILNILVFFFLWSAVFETNQTEVFGYTKEKILTYAFVLIMIRAISLSSRSVDVASQIANGEISNLLVKPLDFFKYWLARDISSKLLNLFFAFFETLILVFLLNPPIFIQTDILIIGLFIFSMIISSLIYFNILMLTNFIPFWMPEAFWGAQFLVIIVIVEFFSGAFFPIDIFPDFIYKILMFTPFPYLIYAPIKIYLGSFTLMQSVKSIVYGTVWITILWYLVKRTWLKGLKVYESYGR